MLLAYVRDGGLEFIWKALMTAKTPPELAILSAAMKSILTFMGSSRLRGSVKNALAQFNSEIGSLSLWERAAESSFKIWIEFSRAYELGLHATGTHGLPPVLCQSFEASTLG